MYIILIINYLIKMKDLDNLKAIFGQIEDHRSHINQLHNLIDILLISIIAVICGAETWKQMSEFGHSKEEFLRTFLELPNGIPSKDTFRRVFSAIDSNAFEQCFIQWVSVIANLSKGQVIAVDGKTLRGAKANGKKSPIHMVSAWACENSLVLGQVRTAAKSNEITAIPELLDILDIVGSTITIDAMGTQTAIADKIINEQANYILAVKENQAQLLEAIKDEFKFSKNIDVHKSEAIGHGRIETRVCSVINDFQFLNDNTDWNALQSIIKVESTRVFKNNSKPTEKATRYFISSLDCSAERYQKDIRSHWGIENKLHWTLDVGFSEDASRKRAGNAAQNYSIVLKIALNLMKNETTEKQGIKGKRLKAAWNNDYLLKILNVKV